MDKYLQYDQIELSEDPSFIRWAKGSEPRDDNNWEEWITNNPNKMETVEKAKSIVLAMKFVSETPSKKTEEKVWSEISTRINSEQGSTHKTKPSRSHAIRMLMYGATAAIVLFLLYINIGNNFDTSISVPFASVDFVTLPDGSKVVINADSELEYDVASWDQKRIVSLKGEAFFSVEKGSKFTVKTNSGTVQVLGTSFNVYDRNKQLKVQCESGKVAVRSKGNETILVKNQAVSVINKQHVFKNNVPLNERRSTWQSGVFVYKETQLSEVIHELERQFDIKVTFEKAIVDVSYNGSFSKNDMRTALTEVFYPLDLKFEINGKTVHVKK